MSDKPMVATRVIKSPIWEVQHKGGGTRAPTEVFYLDVSNISSIRWEDDAHYPEGPYTFCVIHMKSGETHSFISPNTEVPNELLDAWVRCIGS